MVTGFKLLFTVGNPAFQSKPGGEREAKQQLQEQRGTREVHTAVSWLITQDCAVQYETLCETSRCVSLFVWLNHQLEEPAWTKHGLQNNSSTACLTVSQ